MSVDCQYNCKSSASRKPRRFNRHLESVAGGDPGTVLKQRAGPFPSSLCLALPLFSEASVLGQQLQEVSPRFTLAPLVPGTAAVGQNINHSLPLTVAPPPDSTILSTIPHHPDNSTCISKGTSTPVQNRAAPAN